jgi:hypothetical protein
MKFGSLYVASAFIGASLFLAGCGGSQSSSMGSLPTSSGSGAGQHLQNDSGGTCQDGNMKVSPCPITFNSSNPGPIVVTVGRQGNRLVIKETDNCASSGIATLTKVKPRHWSVAAGSTAGSCTAHFTTGGGQGNGVALPITNTL